jgi:hypothetical protein
MTTATVGRRDARWTLLGGVALVALGILSFNAYAAFTGTASYNQSVSTGTMSIVLADEDSATLAYNLAGSNLAPGDTMQRALKLTLGGTVSAGSVTVQAADAGQNALDDGAGVDLQLTIQVCDQAWSETVNGGIPTYACGGTTETVMAATDLGDVITGAQTLDAQHLDLGGVNHLRLTWTLPGAADNTLQNLSNTISLTFASTQRNATSK